MADPGRLSLVGIGPGRPEYLTGRAIACLREATAIVGYELYLAQTRAWLDAEPAPPGGRRYESSRITEERARCERAVGLAWGGETVALISSGDAGLYGMAGLALEILGERGWDGDRPAVEVVPGVTAALAAAAILGAPLMSDHAAISLSDLLTPWEVIERRIAAAGLGDFAVAFYNPVSRRRRAHLRRAAAILLEHRAVETPIGIVRNALREGQTATVTTLGRLATADTNCDRPPEACAAERDRLCIPHTIDMLTIVIVGNSATVTIADRLVTRRGYPTRLEE